MKIEDNSENRDARCLLSLCNAAI